MILIVFFPGNNYHQERKCNYQQVPHGVVAYVGHEVKQLARQPVGGSPVPQPLGVAQL